MSVCVSICVMIVFVILRRMYYYFFLNIFLIIYTCIIVYIIIYNDKRVPIAEIVNKANVLLYCWGIINKYTLYSFVVLLKTDRLCYLNKHMPNTNILYYTHTIHRTDNERDEHLCKQCIFSCSII